MFGVITWEPPGLWPPFPPYCSPVVSSPGAVTMLWINQLPKLHQLISFTQVQLQQQQQQSPGFFIH